MLQKVLENNSMLEKRIKRKRRRGEKINILVVESSSNISKVSLISELKKRSDVFSVVVLSHDQSEASKNLYKALDCEVVLGGNIEDVTINHGIDIIFLENPHYYFDFTEPSHDFYNKLSSRVFESALICYIPYAYISVSNPEVYTDFFHSFSWRFYLESYFHLLELERHTRKIQRLPNQVVTGHPYLDPYFSNEFDLHDAELRKYDSKIKIVWCPHHNPTFYGGISISEQERVLREFIEDNDNVVVFFRPHPNLFGALKSKKHIESNEYKTLLDEDLYKRITSYWLEHPQIVYIERGPIYEYFKCADLIVHNCGGYQMEALASGAKVINLVNPRILSKHILQYEDFQIFCDDEQSLRREIENCIEQPRAMKSQVIGFENRIFAATQIVNDIIFSIG